MNNEFTKQETNPSIMIIKITPQTKDWIEKSSKATGLDEKHVASALLSQAVEELKKKGLPRTLTPPKQ